MSTSDKKEINDALFITVFITRDEKKSQNCRLVLRVCHQSEDAGPQTSRTSFRNASKNSNLRAIVRLFLCKNKMSHGGKSLTEVLHQPDPDIFKDEPKSRFKEAYLSH